MVRLVDRPATTTSTTSTTTAKAKAVAAAKARAKAEAEAAAKAKADAPVYLAPQASSVYDKNCDAVRAAGADPIRVGEPGHSRKLDRDGDGIACE